MSMINRAVLFFMALSLFAIAPVWAEIPTADLTDDCMVDISDLVSFTSQWLDSPGGSANLDGVPGVTLEDYAILSAQWQMGCPPITLVINEFMADNKDFYFDEAGDDDDWLEIYNFGAEPIDMGGMYITDSFSDPAPYQIPTGMPELTTVQAGGFLVIWADGEPAEGPLHASFKLAAGGGEDLALFDSQGLEIDSILDFGPQAENDSYGRMPDAGVQWQFFVHNSPTPATPGHSNGGHLPEDEILISEIMYHPFNADHPLVEDIGEEYIEIYNRGFSAVNLAGWEITDGVGYTFGNVSIGPKEYLVIASDTVKFSAKYPEVTNVIGGWDGRLSNSGEAVELTAASGKVISQITYADQGEWALRKLGPVDYNHRGWEWSDDHDGQGKSLELISMTLPGKYGQNWTASTADQGTPGKKNSALAIYEPVEETGLDIAPLILETKHQPIIPQAGDMVTVTTEIIDEQITGLVTSLHYRLDGQPTYTTVVMTEEVSNGSNETIKYTAQIPAQADGSVVEFYVEVVDSAANTRTWPAPVDVDGTLEQSCNALYQVNDSYDPDAVWQPESQPTYYIIMTEAERAELDQIGSSSYDSDSNAQMNGTFISVDGVDTKLRYNVGVRDRGHGTRDVKPNNYRVNFPTDNPWKNVDAINLNTQYTWLQLAGSAIFQRSGLATGDAKAVQVRVNGANLANSGSPQYSSYVHVDAINSDYTDRKFPDNGAGNVYKCMRIGSEADLRYEGDNPDPYRLHYFKSTNESQDDWSDLIELTRVLSDSTPDDIYVQEINRVINVQQWLRYLALNVLLDNSETTLANGDGDDYYLYRGDVDTRFVLIQHDLDSIFGQGQSIGSATAEIFPFMSGAGGENPVAALSRLVSHPRFASRYYAELKDLIETNLSPEQLDPFLDNVLGGYVPQQTITAMKAWQAQRNAYVLSLIPSDLTIESNLLQSGNYYQTANDSVALAGSADVVRTGSITVNGLVAYWSAIEAMWAIGEGAGGAGEEVIVRRGSTWQYLDNGSDQGTAWREASFNDSSWNSGTAQLGYGGNGEVTTISYGPSSSSKYITTYFRNTFTVDDTSKYTGLRVSLVRDDGAVVYLNGTELIRSNMGTGTITYQTYASSVVGGSDETNFFDYVIDPELLNEGTNVIAVEIHQENTNSSDLSFNLELVGQIDAGPVTNGVPISPGVTRILVQAFEGPEGTGSEIGREYIDIWKNDSVPTDFSGTLTEDTVLDAASGPYIISGDIVVPSGITLTIMPGTTMLFNSGAGITVNGTLIAEGTEYSHINMIPNPASTTRWDGLAIRNTATENRLVYVDMDHGDGQGDSVIINAARVFMNNITFTSTNDSTAFMELTHPQAMIRNCVFPSISGTEPLHGSGLTGSDYLIFDGCTFGAATGYNDIIDFTGGTRPGPIIQMYNNFFPGGGDDALDFDGTDGHIEGNIFLGFVNGHDGDTNNTTANGVATDAESDVLVARNLFIGGDHHMLLKNDVSITAQNNTYIGATMASINFGEPGRGVDPGAGAFLENNIFWDNTRVFYNIFDNSLYPGYGPTPMPSVYNTLIPAEWHYLGSNNIDADPMFVDPASDDYSLQTGSPAIGTGTNGLDMGYLVQAGASISGAPAPVSDSTEATLTIGGPGIVSYSWRLVDNGVAGVWSEEIDLPITATEFPDVSGNILGTLILTNLEDGHTYRVDVLGRNSAGLWQGQTFGENTGFSVPGNPEGNSSESWTVDLSAALQSYKYDSVSSSLGGNADSLLDIYNNGPSILITPAATSISVGGIIESDTVWTAEEGPYEVSSTLVVPAGVTLTIMPGTSVFFAPGTQLTVNGKIRAEGEQFNLIYFTVSPSVTGIWNGIQLEDTIEDNLISYAVVAYAETSNGSIGLTNSEAVLENLAWTGSLRRLVRTDNASVIIRNCVFPDRFGDGEAPGSNDDNVVEAINATGILAGGHYIIENNIFGTNKGHNDIIDFSGPALPGPILEVYNNVFMGSGDECLDLGGDAWIEGNTFMHVHKDVYNTGSGDSNVISTGDDNYDAYIYILRNVFYDIDHVVNLKSGTYMNFEYNTIAGIPEDQTGITYSAIKFGIPGRDVEGKGAYLEGNIFYDIPERIFENIDYNSTGDTGFVTDLQMNGCLIPLNCENEMVGQRPETIMSLGTGNFTADPLFVSPEGDFHLKQSSPAIGVGSGGIDLGAYVPYQAAITGEPGPTTWKTEAELNIGGVGITDYMYRVNGSTWSDERPVSLPVSMAGLTAGQSYTVEVIGKSYMGIWQSDTEPTVSETWTIDTEWKHLAINEILAHNIEIANTDGTYPDMIELYYDGAEPFDLAGMSLKQDPADTGQYVFEANTIIEPGQYLVIYADNTVIQDQIHTGFALNDWGQGIYLYDSSQILVDSIEFGMQIPGCSIGLDKTGEWRLTVPTFGSKNTILPLGTVESVYINEWLANGKVTFVDDFVEFYNDSEWAVDLGGLYITDNPVSEPEKYQMAPLNFIPAKGYAVFDADSQNTPGHLPFRLSSDQGMIALFETDSKEIDWVVYGPQTSDVSQGKSPDGNKVYAFSDIPTPGVTNPATAAIETIQIQLMDIEQDWSYDQSDTALPSGWQLPGYDDSLWPTGAALLYVEGSALPAPKNTALTLGADTYYFRTHFTIDPEINISEITQINFAYIIDDAAVIYINGVEVLRPGFDLATVINHTARSDRSVGNASYEYSSINAADLNLQPGDNVIAVEVHQASSTSTDIVFGLELTAVTEQTQQIEDPLANARKLMNNLRVTEIMYNPAAGSSTVEFIELQNIGTEELDISDVRLSVGITFAFPEMTLAAGEYVVVANDVITFETLYGTGINIAGEYTGSLSNGGENIVLRLPAPLQAAILRMEYNDTWYPTTDGGGYSLVIRDVMSDRAEWNKSSGWNAGTHINGSPGTAE